MTKTSNRQGPVARDCDPTGGAGAGIARIVRMQSEQSSLLREILRESADGARSVADIPNIELFYNLEEVFAQIAHEGRNYLSPVMGYASLLRATTGAEDEAHQWSERIVGGARMMDRYFEQLKIYRTKGMSEVQEMKWSQFIDELLDEFSFYNRNGSQVRIIDNIKGTLVCHIPLLKRVLIHLMRNAVESKEECGIVTLKIGNHKIERGAQLVFRVSDEGGGVSGSKQEFVWKPFFTTKPNHFGLGLSYVAMAAAILDTRVTIESGSGGGATFSFLLKPKGGSIEFTQDSRRR